MDKILILIFSISLFQVHGQNCETFEKVLFHALPDEFPDTINCVDSIGEKQGWWLNYKVKYNEADRPDELEKGDYVERYSFGRYNDNRKVGIWKSVENVHQVYVSRVDSFFYGNDSTIHISNYMDGGRNETKTYFNADSSIIRYTHFLQDMIDSILIECDRELPTEKQCHMTFGEKEKFFPFERFGVEVERVSMNNFEMKRRNE